MLRYYLSLNEVKVKFEEECSFRRNLVFLIENQYFLDG